MWQGGQINLAVSSKIIVLGLRGATMSDGRALLTDSEREYLAGEHGEQRKYEARHRFRRRVEERLREDVEVLEEHDPDLLDELRDVVCRD